MKRGCLVRPFSWLLVLAASACGAGGPPAPALVPAAEPPPPRLATLSPAAWFSPLPASARDERRFPRKTRALMVTEIQGMESILAATPRESADRPALVHRLAEGYGELERMAEADRAGAPAGSHDVTRAGKVAAGARQAAIKYYWILQRDYPQWCGAAPRRCADEALYYAALEYERAGQLDDARKVYLQLIQGWPQSRFIPLAYLAFGELFLEEAQRDPGKLGLAQQAYGEVIKYPPPGNPVYGHGEYRVGQTYARHGDGAQALAHLEKAAAHARASGDAALGALVAEMLGDLRQHPPAGPVDPGSPLPAVANALPSAAPGPSVCSASCSGSPSPELAVSLRASAQRSQACYNDTLRSSDASGSLVVRVQVEESGDVCSVDITSSGARVDTMVPCVRALFDGKRFPPPAGGCVRVNIPLSFQIVTPPGAGP